MSKAEKLAQLFPEDLYKFSDCLTEKEVDVLMEVEAALEKHLRPVITEHSEKAEFPMDAFYAFVNEVAIMSDPRLYEDREDKYTPSQYYYAYLWYLMSRFDTSIATFFGVHGGLGYYTFLLGGSPEQVERWVPKLQNFELQTCFGLTEPEHGSDIAGGLATTATRQGDKWIINGEKRWIGGAGSADVLPIFARDTEDNKIKCFILEKGQKGLTIDKIENIIALRMVQNGHITMKDVEVADDHRLVNINGFKDVARVLYVTRSGVANLAAGNSAGAFRAALKYTKERKQFTKSLVEFQLVQEKLARMQANVISELALITQIAKLQTSGEFDEVRSSIAKMFNSLRSRETVALAREVCGGNGITYDYDVARFFQDAEAIYTYEGTHEVNSLVIGRAITGKGAFV